MGFYSCPLCSTNLPNVANWLSHIRLVHSSDPNFAITCGIDQCARTFKKFSAFNSHIYRNHRDVVMLLKEEVPVTHDAGNSYEGISTERFQPVVTVENTLPEVSQLLNIDKEEQEIASAKFILKLKEGRSMSQTSVNDVVEGCQLLFDHTLTRVRAGVKERLSRSGIDPQDIDGLQEFFEEVEDPFSNLKTAYKQEKAFEKHFGYKVSFGYHVCLVNMHA